MDYAHNGSTKIAYETFGDGEPVLLIMGIGSQMVIWPEGFCAELASRGFAVTRFDNRDTGLSTHFPEDAEYRLEDMADDAVATLDARGEASAHVVGLSMGRAITQVLATHHTQRRTRRPTTPQRGTRRPTAEVGRGLSRDVADFTRGI